MWMPRNVVLSYRFAEGGDIQGSGHVVIAMSHGGSSRNRALMAST